MKGCRSAVSSRGSSVSTSKKPAPPPARLYQPLRLSGRRLPRAWCCSRIRCATCWRVVWPCHLKEQYHSIRLASLFSLQVVYIARGSCQKHISLSRSFVISCFISIRKRSFLFVATDRPGMLKHDRFILTHQHPIFS